MRLFAAIFLFLATAPLAAQFVVSAMAGFIHHAEGEVFLQGKEIHPKPTEFLHVQEGWRLRTGRGRAEIMLTPGSFVRLGPESELEMVSAGLVSAELRLYSGSLLVDLVDLLDDGVMSFDAADAKVSLVKPGLYRLDAVGNAPPRLRVFRGRAEASLGGSKRQRVKGNRELRLTADAKPEKFRLKDPDELREWSDGRSAMLAQKAKAVRKQEMAGMSAAERALLEMIMHRPSPRPPSSGMGGASRGGSSSGSTSGSGSQGGSGGSRR